MAQQIEEWKPPIEDNQVEEWKPSAPVMSPIVKPALDTVNIAKAKMARPSFFKGLDDTKISELIKKDPNLVNPAPTGGRGRADERIWNATESFDKLGHKVTNKLANSNLPKGMAEVLAPIASLAQEPFRLLGEISSDPTVPAISMAGAAKNRLAKSSTPKIESVKEMPSIESKSIGKIESLPEPQIKPTVDAPMAGPKVPEPPIKPPISNTIGGVSLPGESPVDKLLKALDEARPLRKIQEQLYTAERARRIGDVEKIRTTGEAGMYERLGAMKGEMPKVHFESIRTKLEQADVDSLSDAISQNTKINEFEKLTARTGLIKILGGKGGLVPQESELKVLRLVYGDKFVSTIKDKLPLLDKRLNLVSETVNLPKELLASYDMSAPFRQGLGLVHKKEFYKALPDMFRAYGDENAFKATMESIRAKPTFEFGQRSGLSITDLIDSREEAFLSSLGERIPVIGRGVKASNRAYVAFLDKLRADTFESLVNSATKSGTPITESLGKELANFVNTATGRGSLGSLEHSARGLNTLLFSPRLIASRVRMLNPGTYINASSTVRKEYLKSLVAMTSFGLTVNELAKLSGAKVSNNPVSSDFMKPRFGNTREDQWGGFQQYVIAASRLITGKQGENKYELGSRYGLPTRLDVLARFGEGKLNPALGLAAALLRGSELSGEKITKETLTDKDLFNNTIARRFIPLFLQDLNEIVRDDPSLLPLAIPAAFGMGSQTYADREQKVAMPKGVPRLRTR